MRRLVCRMFSDTQLSSSVPSCISGLRKLKELELTHNTKLEGPLYTPPSLDRVYALARSLACSYSYGVQLICLELQSRAIAYSGISGNFSSICAKRVYADRSRVKNLAGICECTQIQALYERRREWPWSLGRAASAQLTTHACLYVCVSFGVDLLLIRWASGLLLGERLPECLFTLERLEYLVLDGNNLSGTIPPSVGNLTKLKALELAANKLRGTLPETMHRLQQLEQLLLGNNHLTGELPEWISNFSALRALLLGTNAFTGTLPTSWSSLTNLSALVLSSNQLSGSIPSEYRNMRSLSMVYVPKSPSALSLAHQRYSFLCVTIGIYRTIASRNLQIGANCRWRRLTYRTTASMERFLRSWDPSRH